MRNPFRTRGRHTRYAVARRRQLERLASSQSFGEHLENLAALREVQ